MGELPRAISMEFGTLGGQAVTARVERMRQDAIRIFKAALAAVDPEAAVLGHVSVRGTNLRLRDREWDLGSFQNIYVVGAGKAAAPMAKAIESLLGERITDGVVVVKEGHGLSLERVRVREASHPVPDERGILGTKEVLELARRAGPDDLVVALLSGGGSALLIAPAQGISLEDKQEVTRLLLKCGATIQEINAVRKHLSAVKGGQLARAAQPATLVSLILSDVIGDDLDAIASGPTVPDPTDFHQARQVPERYGVWETLPGSVKARLEAGIAGKISETPKAGDSCFEKSHWEIVGSNFQALKSAKDKADELGYRTLILGSGIEGEAREVAKVLSAVAKEVARSGNPLPTPACLLAGGETTVTLKGGGLGGRNQELVLAAAMALEGWDDVVVLSGGTDGTDGPTDAAGAIADGRTVVRARRAGLYPAEHLDNNDSYTFFRRLGDLLFTGPTRTNVMDIQVLLVGYPER